MMGYRYLSIVTLKVKNKHMELKQQIIKYIFDNKDDFQLVNATIKHFSNYIYDYKNDGYLIGGELIAEFIKKAIDLIIHNK